MQFVRELSRTIGVSNTVNTQADDLFCRVKQHSCSGLVIQYQCKWLTGTTRLQR